MGIILLASFTLHASSPTGVHAQTYGLDSVADHEGVGGGEPYGAPRAPLPPAPPLPPAAPVPPNEPIPGNYEPWYSVPEDSERDPSSRPGGRGRNGYDYEYE